MVLPVLGALAGAGGSIAAALIGADAQDTATQYNWMANIYNLRQREKERRESKQYADELRGEQKLGATDAQGNRTYFKEGVGWVTELDPDQQALQDYFFKQELPARQDQFQRTASRSREEDDIAGAMLNEFRRVARESPREIENLLYSVATDGISKGTREAVEVASRQGLRTGNSGLDKIIAEIARANMDARGDAKVKAKLQSKDYVDNKFDKERGTSANLYNLFASRADNKLGSSFDPSGIGGNQLMQLFAQLAQQGNSQGFNAAQMRGGTLQDIEPNMAYANAAGAIGSSLAGLGERSGAYFDKQQNNNLMRQYISNGGDFSMAGGGIFDTIANRTVGNTGQGLF